MSNGVIIDGFIAVDKFVSLESIEYFFLTHAHSDHYGGLNVSFLIILFSS